MHLTFLPGPRIAQSWSAFYTCFQGAPPRNVDNARGIVVSSDVQEDLPEAWIVLNANNQRFLLQSPHTLMKKLLLILLFGVSTSGSGWSQTADTVLINGKILTVDRQFSTHEAI